MAQGSWAAEAASTAHYVDQSEGDHTAPTLPNSKVSVRLAAPAAMKPDLAGEPANTPSAGDDPDNDRWAWPHGTAATGAELDTFTARLAQFAARGLSLADAEAMADKLLNRDREADDRRACLECASLRGTMRNWSCGNWQAGGVAINPRFTQLPHELVMRLQRCDGCSARTAG